eukprot:TRINITY_DN25072_c0_g1_i1.p2 TRINITY_DN25072_c0_g1~~TRINITY_DN25072_c0_g1_i1.p2  ORF type:complete len:245 (+),score=102.72 TRINITY_DN25072_c0_g1_i1:50-784(+)
MGVLAENKTYTQAIAFFDKADGRDKLFKTLQNFSKFLAWHFTIKALTAPNDARPAARQSAARYSKLAKTLSSYRQLHKFFKWLKTIRDIQGVLQNPSDLSPGDVIDTVSSICDVGYKVSDNIEFLTDLKFLDGNAKTWEKQSKFFQFYCYLLAVVYHLLCISRMNEPTKQELSLSDNERRAAHRLRKRKILLDFVKDFADFLRVSVGQGYITFIPKPVVPAFAGIMGTVAGGIGTMQVWEKVAK